MTVFEWIKNSTIKDLAEWLVAFQDQSEINVLEKLEADGYSITRIQLHHSMQVLKMIQELQEEIKSEESV